MCGPGWQPVHGAGRTMTVRGAWRRAHHDCACVACHDCEGVHMGTHVRQRLGCACGTRARAGAQSYWSMSCHSSCRRSCQQLVARHPRSASYATRYSRVCSPEALVPRRLLVYVLAHHSSPHLTRSLD